MAAAPPPTTETPTDPGNLRGAISRMEAIALEMAAAAASSHEMTREQVAFAVSAVKTLSTKLDTVAEQLAKKISADAVETRGLIAEVDRKTDLNTEELARLALAPTRKRHISLPEILEGVHLATPLPPAPSSQAVTSPAPILSVSPLEAAVSGASIHAITNAVPSARKANARWSLLLAVLIVLAQALQIIRGH